VSPSLDTWRKKLDYLQQQEAIMADAAQKFSVAQQIEEAKAKIAGLEAIGGSSGRTVRQGKTKPAYRMFVGIVAGCIVLLTGVWIVFLSLVARPDVPYSDAVGTISRPSDGDTVTHRFEASGTVHNVGRDVYLWLLVEINGRTWPKEGTMIVDKSDWKQSVREDGNPDQFGLSLWAASSDANVQIRAWMEHGQRTGVYPEFHPVPGMKRLAQSQGLRVAANR
jgi:hypothetical protein